MACCHGCSGVNLPATWRKSGAVELRSLATATNGMRFDNRYCMLLTFDSETIVRGRTYLDSALVARLFEENPIA